MKRGTVYLEDHCTEWETAALHTIDTIKNVLGEISADVEHVGSTSIKIIPAKPIIDIAVGVFDIDAVLLKKDALADKNIIFRFEESNDKLLFVMGDLEKDTRTHHIHVVKYGSADWENYLYFRDYLNTNKAAADKYAALKIALAEKYLNDRIAYTNGKSTLINLLLDDARIWRDTK